MKTIWLVIIRALPCTDMQWNIKEYSLNAQKCGGFSFTGVHRPSHRIAAVKICPPANTMLIMQRRENSSNANTACAVRHYKACWDTV